MGNKYLIVVHVEIVGGREDGYETWEASGLAFAVHPVPGGVIRLEECQNGRKMSAQCI